MSANDLTVREGILHNYMMITSSVRLGKRFIMGCGQAFSVLIRLVFIDQFC